MRQSSDITLAYSEVALNELASAAAICLKITRPGVEVRAAELNLAFSLPAFEGQREFAARHFPTGVIELDDEGCADEAHGLLERAWTCADGLDLRIAALPASMWSE